MSASTLLRLCCLLALTASGLASSAATAADRVDYLSEVKPLLAAKCYACHGRLKQEADLRLETLELMDEGGVLVPGDAEASTLFERIIADEDMRMPPPHEGAALKPDEVDILRRWIDQGAEAPEEAIPESPSQHWAFQRIERPALPPHEAGVEHPIDAFLHAQQSARQITPVPLAPRSLRLRRLYLDLIGLPPTVEQLQDARPWEEIVDELLHDPQHGPRWARHWMDIWRYSDWYGLGKQLRYSQKHMWRWRDWIIQSVNADKGYDRMIQEMLAGDELAPDDPEVVAGTGFLARNYYLFNRTTWLDSTIEHTGKAFLGLTLNCAKCHDHKYDPISHIDYYSFRAIFEPHQVRLDPVPGQTDFERDGLPRVFDDHLDAETHLHLRGDPKQPDMDTKIEPRVPELLVDFQPPVQPIDLPPTAYAPAIREHVQRDLLAAADADIESAHQAWQAAEAAAEKAARQAADMPTGDLAGTETFHFHDDFDGERAEVWQRSGDGWKYEDGKLLQTKITRDPESLRLNQSLPRDFDLRCRYTTTGGSVYKSVTFRFDDCDDGRYNQFVYTSAHAPGPKVQVALTRDGKSQYPPAGRKSTAIEVGKTYELRFAVRDRLVNVWLDDQFMVAYALPNRRPEGQLTVSGFDATVAFDSLTIDSLADDVELTPAEGAAVSSVDDLQTAAQLAEARWSVAKAKRQALTSALAADTARLSGQDEQQSAMLTKQAALDEAEVLRCEADLERLAAAEDAKKIKAADAKQQQAQKQRQAAEQGEGSYTSVRASRKALETPEHKFGDYPAVYPSTSSGRRLALARWMTSRENPLTARVAVNHIWTRHFGEPLVESVFDFGLRAKRPQHQKLLDYLACELMDSGWSMRHLHRLMCTSQAYQRASSTAAADATTLAADPTNNTYWHANTRRMEAQVVRDAVLHLAGTLDLTIGGPAVAANGDSRRRSVYFKHSRDDLNKFLSMFDDADLLQCYRRSESVVPQQALAMANSKLTLSTAAEIAARLAESTQHATAERAIAATFAAVLGRQPNQPELAECLQYCQQLAPLTGEPAPDQDHPKLGLKTQTRLVHVLLNHNDFVSIR
ncbi:PSD1 and planctomycete cytochrome C domain-containing protein [Roseimaritima ulvae]|uniref:Planctomycete cytochrome C n=1 Tax=Roseimaritima ulvae TaxID=980254 RepID=A0A5B9QXB5_9BACT|nr:PSD1 and planctomycete cytochrome C domain-containing protein [Roseimaritima ulvae]QEG42450.1 Planctomycete cytochrome C [Roseimaritima ulvae]